MKLTKEFVSFQFRKVRFLGDRELDVREYDNRLKDGQIDWALAGYSFCDEQGSEVIRLRVYDNGEFLVGSAACAMEFGAIGAYSRAYEFLSALAVASLLDEPK